MADDPWHAAAPPPTIAVDVEARRRYQRAHKLSEMRWKLERIGHIARYERQARYWRACLDRWQDYLDGRFPQRGEW
jgi:hypothetical protein